MLTCVSCQFELWHPIISFGVSTLGAYNDARFPGRSLLVLNEHHTDFSDLDEVLLGKFASDAQRAARAIRDATGAPRVNYAILGNAEPHLHWHLIPRIPSAEPLPERSPWDDPRSKQALPTAEFQRLYAAIGTHARNDGVRPPLSPKVVGRDDTPGRNYSGLRDTSDDA